MERDKDYQYFDLKKSERDAVIGYLLNTLLQARESCHIPSNEKGYDEDVNITWHICCLHLRYPITWN